MRRSKYSTHGFTRSHPHLYKSWLHMNGRCSNPNHKGYHIYGGRGITICDEWQDSKTFCEWALNNGWQKGYNLHRRDNDGPYSPGNCVWLHKTVHTMLHHIIKNRI